MARLCQLAVGEVLAPAPAAGLARTSDWLRSFAGASWIAYAGEGGTVVIASGPPAPTGRESVAPHQHFQQVLRFRGGFCAGGHAGAESEPGGSFVVGGGGGYTGADGGFRGGGWDRDMGSETGMSSDGGLGLGMAIPDEAIAPYDVSCLAWGGTGRSAGTLAVAYGRLVHILSPQGVAKGWNPVVDLPASPLSWKCSASLSHQGPVSCLSWTESGDGLLSAGVEVVMWRRRRTAGQEGWVTWQRLWQRTPPLRHHLAAASWSADLFCASSEGVDTLGDVVDAAQIPASFGGEGQREDPLSLSRRVGGENGASGGRSIGGAAPMVSGQAWKGKGKATIWWWTTERAEGEEGGEVAAAAAAEGEGGAPRSEASSSALSVGGGDGGTDECEKRGPESEGTLVEIELPHAGKVLSLQWRPEKTSVVGSYGEGVSAGGGGWRRRGGHIFRPVLLTNCEDGTVRLWIEIDSTFGRLGGGGGGGGSKNAGAGAGCRGGGRRGVYRPVFFVATVIELGFGGWGVPRAPSGEGGRDAWQGTTVTWAQEVRAGGSAAQLQQQQRPGGAAAAGSMATTPSVAAGDGHVAPCEWIVGISLEGTVTMWAVYFLDDVMPPRCPRVITWQEGVRLLPPLGSSSDSIAAHLAMTGGGGGRSTFSYPSRRFGAGSEVLRCVVQRAEGASGSTPTAVEVCEKLPHGGFRFSRLWPPVTAVGPGGGRGIGTAASGGIAGGGGGVAVGVLSGVGSQKMGGAWGVASEVLELVGHEARVVDLALHPSPGMSIGASLDEQGRVMTWRTCEDACSPGLMSVSPTTLSGARRLPIRYYPDGSAAAAAGEEDCQVPPYYNSLVWADVVVGQGGEGRRGLLIAAHNTGVEIWAVREGDRCKKAGGRGGGGVRGGAAETSTTTAFGAPAGGPSSTMNVADDSSSSSFSSCVATWEMPRDLLGEGIERIFLLPADSPPKRGGGPDEEFFLLVVVANAGLTMVGLKVIFSAAGGGRFGSSIRGDESTAVLRWFVGGGTPAAELPGAGEERDGCVFDGDDGRRLQRKPEGGGEEEGRQVKGEGGGLQVRTEVVAVWRGSDDSVSGAWGQERLTAAEAIPTEMGPSAWWEVMTLARDSRGVGARKVGDGGDGEAGRVASTAASRSLPYQFVTGNADGKLQFWRLRVPSSSASEALPRERKSWISSRDEDALGSGYASSEAAGPGNVSSAVDTNGGVGGWECVGWVRAHEGPVACVASARGGCRLASAEAGVMDDVAAPCVRIWQADAAYDDAAAAAASSSSSPGQGWGSGFECEGMLSLPEPVVSLQWEEPGNGQLLLAVGTLGAMRVYAQRAVKVTWGDGRRRRSPVCRSGGWVCIAYLETRGERLGCLNWNLRGGLIAAVGMEVWVVSRWVLVTPMTIEDTEDVVWGAAGEMLEVASEAGGSLYHPLPPPGAGGGGRGFLPSHPSLGSLVSYPSMQSLLHHSVSVPALTKLGAGSSLGGWGGGGNAGTPRRMFNSPSTTSLNMSSALSTASSPPLSLFSVRTGQNRRFPHSQSTPALSSLRQVTSMGSIATAGIGMDYGYQDDCLQTDETEGVPVELVVGQVLPLLEAAKAVGASLPDYHPRVLIQYLYSGHFGRARACIRHLARALLGSAPSGGEGKEKEKGRAFDRQEDGPAGPSMSRANGTCGWPNLIPSVSLVEMLDGEIEQTGAAESQSSVKSGLLPGGSNTGTFGFGSSSGYGATARMGGGARGMANGFGGSILDKYSFLNSTTWMDEEFGDINAPGKGREGAESLSEQQGLIKRGGKEAMTEEEAKVVLDALKGKDRGELLLGEGEKVQLLAVVDVLAETDSQRTRGGSGEGLDRMAKRFRVASRLRTALMQRKKECVAASSGADSGPGMGTGSGAAPLSTAAKQKAVESPVPVGSVEIAWVLHSEAKAALYDMCVEDPPSWPALSELGVGYWLTNPADLRPRMEKLARAQYLLKKDPKDCFLLYLALDRKAVLAGLMKLSKDERDKKLYEFLGRDFKEEKNRAAALKNAYVLMGQHRYELASGFFLLGGDMLSAATVCVKNMDDPQLGLVICRLKESSPSGGESLGKVGLEMVNRYMLKAARDAGDRWKASMLLWIVGNKLGAMKEVVGFDKGDSNDSPVKDSGGGRDFERRLRRARSGRFSSESVGADLNLADEDEQSCMREPGTLWPLDPEVGDYCGMIASKPAMQLGTVEQEAKRIAVLASIRAAYAFDRAGMQLEALERLPGINGAVGSVWSADSRSRRPSAIADGSGAFVSGLHAGGQRQEISGLSAVGAEADTGQWTPSGPEGQKLSWLESQVVGQIRHEMKRRLVCLCLSKSLEEHPHWKTKALKQEDSEKRCKGEGVGANKGEKDGPSRDAEKEDKELESALRIAKDKWGINLPELLMSLSLLASRRQRLYFLCELSSALANFLKAGSTGGQIQIRHCPSTEAGLDITAVVALETPWVLVKAVLAAGAAVAATSVTVLTQDADVVLWGGVCPRMSACEEILLSSAGSLPLAQVHEIVRFSSAVLRLGQDTRKEGGEEPVGKDDWIGRREQVCQAIAFFLFVAASWLGRRSRSLLALLQPCAGLDAGATSISLVLPGVHENSMDWFEQLGKADVAGGAGEEAGNGSVEGASKEGKEGDSNPISVDDMWRILGVGLWDRMLRCLRKFLHTGKSRVYERRYSKGAGTGTIEMRSRLPNSLPGASGMTSGSFGTRHAASPSPPMSPRKSLLSLGKSLLMPNPPALLTIPAGPVGGGQGEWILGVDAQQALELPTADSKGGAKMAKFEEVGECLLAAVACISSGLKQQVADYVVQSIIVAHEDASAAGESVGMPNFTPLVLWLLSEAPVGLSQMSQNFPSQESTSGPLVRHGMGSPFAGITTSSLHSSFTSALSMLPAVLSSGTGLGLGSGLGALSGLTGRTALEGVSQNALPNKGQYPPERFPEIVPQLETKDEACRELWKLLVERNNLRGRLGLEGLSAALLGRDSGGGGGGGGGEGGSGGARGGHAGMGGSGGVGGLLNRNFFKHGGDSNHFYGHEGGSAGVRGRNTTLADDQFGNAQSHHRWMSFGEIKEVWRMPGELLEAVCINSLNSAHLAIATNRKGLSFWNLDKHEPLTLASNGDMRKVVDGSKMAQESHSLANGSLPATAEKRPMGKAPSKGGGRVPSIRVRGGSGGAGYALGVPGGGGIGAWSFGWDEWEDVGEWPTSFPTVETVSCKLPERRTNVDILSGDRRPDYRWQILSRLLYNAADDVNSSPKYEQISANAARFKHQFGGHVAKACYGTMASSPVAAPYFTGPVNAVRFDVTGQQFVSASGNGTVSTWSVESGLMPNCGGLIGPTEMRQCFNKHACDAEFIGGNIVIGAGTNSTGEGLVMWDTLCPPTSGRTGIHCHDGAARSVALIDVNGREGSSFLIASGGRGGDLDVHDLRYMFSGAMKGSRMKGANGSLWHIPKAHTASITSLAAIPGTSLFLTGSKDGDVKLWDATNCRQLICWQRVCDRRTFINARGFGTVMKAAVMDVLPTPRGFLTCGADGLVKLFPYHSFSRGAWV
ncbi:hypothetical protein CBR_g19326 [Chara braunii]|uniref:RAVE complex protein Rav1 C-terminal domain-containing protein n=1 Tax=Chara braunii TaxID=69332 RepID=A0A388KXM8_CHABU|nr:hypothetical protein CBR_g19326 [Chara braunii]|eukprot:GBG74814.1 hypothetical protein CBR_g19326 [Chara braunii]